MLIQGENDDKRFRLNPEEKGQYSKHNAYLVDVVKSDSKCYFCDENENHIATNGPKCSKIVQHFTCQKFTEMTPTERYQLLRKKGYCIQCLFLGAYQDKGERGVRKCQRGFFFNHQSHKIHATKKHVLVCHARRRNAENRQLLQEYNDLCIMRQTQLPAFSKGLKLIFHTNQQTTNSNHEVNFSNEEKAIYILQTIKVGQQQYSLFYDTGCCNMV